ncbi:hypothetical protein ACHAXT_012671 [Thalassiosira profunda]
MVMMVMGGWGHTTHLRTAPQLLCCVLHAKRTNAQRGTATTHAMPPKKRPAAVASASSGGPKRRRAATAVRIAAPKRSDDAPTSASTSATPASVTASIKANPLYEEFVQLLSLSQHKGRGISNATLKSHFGESKYPQLVPIINELTRASRLAMSKSALRNGESEVYFSLLSAEGATKLQGLDASSKMVYQVIEGSGNKGIWTVDVRVQTNIQQATLTKIFKQLEARRLIKPIKAVTAKTKKLYMLYDLTPSKEITGGPWYSDYEFDHEFIAELRNFILMCIRRMNGGRGVGNGVTLKQIAGKMAQANVSRVPLSLDDVRQLLNTLEFDYMVERRGATEGGEALYVAAKPVTTYCQFGWWDVLSPDFHFRGVRFEDDVYLGPHEPHHHT